MKKIISNTVALLVICTAASVAQALPEKILREISKAVVKIKMQQISGEVRVFTGFIIDESGTCMTDIYNLKNALWGSILSEDGSEYEIDRIVAVNEAYGAAKFTLKNTGARKFPFLRSATDPRSSYRYATFITRISRQHLGKIKFDAICKSYGQGTHHILSLHRKNTILGISFSRKRYRFDFFA